MKINLTIDRLEGEKAILKDADNNTIVWPRTKIPEEFKEGQNLVFDISSSDKGGVSESQDPKDILNEILDINE